MSRASVTRVEGLPSNKPAPSAQPPLQGSISPLAAALVDAADKLSADLTPVPPSGPVAFIYNPLVYARGAHTTYLRQYANSRKRILFLGMNPGPFGMAQTGVPFGEVASVKGWLGIHSGVIAPEIQHPKRAIEGFDCTRSEVSGRRLWSFFRSYEPDPARFFATHFVANYCPLLFLNERGANVTPDKLGKEARQRIEAACDLHLATVIEVLQPDHLVGVGDFAKRCAMRIACRLPSPPQVHSIIHPSPASPTANREWPIRPREQMRQAGLWP